MKIKKVSVITPKSVICEKNLRILWKNDKEQQFNYFGLRYHCPCAGCVDELTGNRIIQPEDVALNIHPLRSEYVGNYAIRIYWSDGHSTGIYSYSSLYNNHPADTEKQKGSSPKNSSSR